MVPYGPGIPQINPAPRLRTIVKPGTPGWVTAVVQTPSRGDAASVLSQLGIVGGGVGLILFVGVGIAQLGVSSPVAATAAMAAFVVGVLGFGMFWWRVFAPNVVSAPSWRYRGVALKGEALRLLEDIDSRFHYAERMVDEVPTGIDWSEVADHVQALMWDSAGHAARITTLDAEIHEMRYAAGAPRRRRSAGSCRSGALSTGA